MLRVNTANAGLTLCELQGWWQLLAALPVLRGAGRINGDWKVYSLIRPNNGAYRRRVLRRSPVALTMLNQQASCNCSTGWTGTDCSVRCPSCLGAASGGGGTCVPVAQRCSPTWD